jgi:hypothetical protein
MLKLLVPLPKQITVACSGGVDSMAVVDFLKRKHDVTVAHFHHGTENGQKAFKFVAQYCTDNNIPMTFGTPRSEKSKEEIANKYGFKAVMTSNLHQSGTDRIYEASEILALDDEEIIVNVQADEPFIEPEVVQKVIDKIKNLNRDFVMVSCYKKIEKEFATDPNHVKVIVDVYGDAIYFSRSKIPYDREEHQDYFGHLGIYGFNKKSLKAFFCIVLFFSFFFFFFF